MSGKYAIQIITFCLCVYVYIHIYYVYIYIHVIATHERMVHRPALLVLASAPVWELNLTFSYLPAPYLNNSTNLELPQLTRIVMLFERHTHIYKCSNANQICNHSPSTTHQWSDPIKQSCCDLIQSMVQINETSLQNNTTNNKQNNETIPFPKATTYNIYIYIYIYI